jgi:EAL and modified HD-GYP domain-containing signal transduction protein
MFTLQPAGAAPPPNPTEPRRALAAAELRRQAIFDSKRRVWAYELTYRSEEGERTFSDPDADTSSVVLSAFAELGLDRVVGLRKAFIGASRSVLSGDAPLPVSAGRVALSVRDYEHVTDELVPSLERHKREGFDLALDDFSFSDDAVPLLHVADYVRLDFRRHGAEGMQEHRELLARWPVRIIAVNLATYAEFRLCVELGCDHFQGPFLFRPEVLRHRRMPSNLQVLAQLLAELNRDNVDNRRIEEIVKRDPSLSVAVFRLLSSSAFGLRYKVSSISHAVSLLGLRDFSRWVALVALASQGAGQPSEIVTTGLVRARACENMARKVAVVSSDAAFIVGLFSVLDALLQCPLAQVLGELPVHPSVRAAVVEHSGLLGEMLTRVVEHERGTPSNATMAERVLVAEAWLDAVEWAGDVSRELETAGAGRSIS